MEIRFGDPGNHLRAQVGKFIRQIVGHGVHSCNSLPEILYAPVSLHFLLQGSPSYVRDKVQDSNNNNANTVSSGHPEQLYKLYTHFAQTWQKNHEY